MKRRISQILILILSLFTSNSGQTTLTTTQQQAQQDNEDVVRISTNLVQVDAVVTDKNGKLVTDLRPEEVEIFEDGRPQKITNFSFVSTDSGVTQPLAATPGAPVDKLAPPVPPVRLRPDQVRRTIALVVDDLGLSFESAPAVKKGLKKYVDQQLQPNDLVAIIRTGGGIGALQQFTSDKRQLYAAIERVRWNPMGRSGLSSFSPLRAKTNSDQQTAIAGRNPALAEVDDGRGPGGEGVDDLREEFFSVGSLGALNYVIRGMKELPGRKSILLISDGLKLFSASDPQRISRVLESMRHLIDQANRASVVIYTMDARGVPYLGFTAEDSGSGMSGPELIEAMAARRTESFEWQEGLNFLARETGGFPIFNSNDISVGIRRAIDDQKGYYLIGYRPDEATFDSRTGRRKFHQIRLKIKRPGVNHRTRTGFYGTPEAEAADTPSTSAQKLLSALTSPFNSGSVRLRLTSLFSNDQKVGSFVRSLLHVNMSDLTFVEEADGWRKATFEVLVASFGDNGAVIDHVGQTQTVRIQSGELKNALEDGLVFILTLPVKKPGAYQLRAALLDKGTERTGSASQFIEVPDLNKSRLTLSGIILNADRLTSKPTATKEAEANNADGIVLAASNIQARRTEKEIAGANPLTIPAIRKFNRGMILRFNYMIYNAQVDRRTRLPQPETQVRLFRDGRRVFDGKVQKLEMRNQADLQRLVASGRLLLGGDLIPGEYILQVIVNDPLAREKYRTATQWVDFEIVR